jgi:hypothetical protein
VTARHLDDLSILYCKRPPRRTMRRMFVVLRTARAPPASCAFLDATTERMPSRRGD